MSFDKERLYQLIPTVYRLKDEAIAAATGVEKGPLKAFIELFSEQVLLLEDDLDKLYEDQFIETCSEWVVPYIGDLVGARDLFSIPGNNFSARAQVANTLAYRRRKGTVSVIEQLARDITGWPVNVIEYFQKLSTTQYLNHLRPKNISITGVRNSYLRELANTPFDPYSHTIDVRNISSQRGRYNIFNIGIFLWRIAAHSVTRGPAYRIDADRLTFDCLGRDVPLYNYPIAEDDISQVAAVDNVPIPIGRLRMHKNIERYYGPGGKSVWLYDIPVEEIKICNLSDDGNGNWWNTPATKITIDPVLGRIAFPPGTAPGKLYVNYYYGFAGKIGAGEYGRDIARETTSLRTVRVPGDQPTIHQAINELSSMDGVIELTENDYYIETPVINLDEGQHIEIKAAEGKRPILVLGSDLNIHGDDNSSVSFNGVFVVGGCLKVPANKPGGFLNELGELKIGHCTLLPSASPEIDSVIAQPLQPRIIIETISTSCIISNSITGALIINENSSCEIRDCIIDASQEDEFAYKGLVNYGGKLTIKNTTVIGRVATSFLSLATNCIFKSAEIAGAPVSVKRTQEGCMRFSYVPLGSIVPKKYKCQPVNMAHATKVRPIFNSLEFANAAYGQLNEHCAKEILEGADNGSEMGVFCQLHQSQRVDSLRKKLNEYLRFGLEGGIFFGS